MKYLLPTILAILLIAVAIGIYDQDGITGNAVATTGPGCCLNSCTQSSADQCPQGQFLPGESCGEVRECNIGCCQDAEGYCYSNYVRATCEREGANFIGARECPEFQGCLVAPSEPADPEGYAYLNEDGVLGIKIEPSGGLRGESFSVTTFTFDEQSDVKLRFGIVSTDELIDRIALDGGPGDERAGDKGYTTTFDSSIVPANGGIQKVIVRTVLNDELIGAYEEFYVSTDGCLPLYKHDINPFRQSIVFTRAPSLDYMDIHGRAQSIAMDIIRNSSSLFSEYNLYYHKTPTNNPESTCAQVDNDNRITVHLSSSYSGCTQNGNMVWASNDIQRKSEKSVKNTSFTKDFCSYVYSPLEKQAELYESLLDPEVEILSPPNSSTITTPTTQVRFKVNDNNQNASFRYRILYNENANELAWGYGIVGEEITHEIPTQDGINAILVKVEDAKGNPGANYTITQSNQSNFFVQTNLVEGQVYTNGIDFEVTYTHNTAQNISYLVYDRTVLVGQGIAQNATPSPVELDLRAGPHDIRVVAFDNNQRRASTKEVTVVQLNAFQPTATQAPSTASPITGSVIYDPYGGSSSSTDPTSRVSGINQSIIGPDGFQYFPIDLNGLYEPQQLCGLPDAEPGIKYISIDCINADFNTELQALTDLKVRGEKSYEYTFNYDILTCSIGTLVDIYMQTCINPTDETVHPAIRAAVNSDGCYRETVDRVTLDEGYRIVDSTTYKSFGDFKDLCIMVSDPSVEQAMPYCLPFGEPECRDGIDNDGDGSCDYEGCGTLPADPGCSDLNDNREDDGTPQCSDGIDNDNDGSCDATGCLGLPADPACLLGATPLPAHNNEGSGTTQCQDGIDNDGDGTCDHNGCIINGFDYPKDPACTSSTQNNEAAATTACQDGVDNDGDGTCDYNGCIDHLGAPLPPDAACFTDPECYVDNSCADKRINTEFATFYPCDVSDDSQFSASGTALRLSEGYQYSINYEFFACRENTIVEVILDGEAKSRVDEIVLDKDDSHVDSRFFDNDVLYTTLCIKASDSSFGTQCIDLQLI